jgi:hypothetical protein
LNISGGSRKKRDLPGKAGGILAPVLPGKTAVPEGKGRLEMNVFLVFDFRIQ